MAGLVVLTPWVSSNYSLTGKWIPASSWGWAPFYHGIQVSKQMLQWRDLRSVDARADRTRHDIVVERLYRGDRTRAWTTTEEMVRHEDVARDLVLSEVRQDTVGWFGRGFVGIAFTWFQTLGVGKRILSLAIHVPLLVLFLAGMISMARRDTVVFSRLTPVLAIIVFVNFFQGFVFPFVRYMTPAMRYPSLSLHDRSQLRSTGGGLKLTILIPAYNEEATVAELLDRVLEVDVGCEKEIIVVDDASTDGTARILQRYSDRILVLRHERNRGKGRALRTGLTYATGDHVVPQDADLEYEPADIRKLVEVAQRDGVRVVYGSRRLDDRNRQYSGLMFYLGGILVTWIANLIYGLRLTDEPTCYKLVEREALEAMELECERFEFCAEVTAKAARLDLSIIEVPIIYRPRHINEGKKIRAKDGLEAIRTLLRYRHWRPRSLNGAAASSPPPS